MFTVEAVDGQQIRGYIWRDTRVSKARSRPVVVINSATSVLCQYYSRFAEFLAANDHDVLVYDYRGIGLSRPRSLRGFEASWLDWGCRDFEAVLQFVQKSFPDQPIFVVAHSVGGFLLGLAGSNGLVSRVVTVGAQYAYWRDYAPSAKLKMILKWHVLMPVITLLFGYFPGKRLGWLEDTPKGVVRDWVFSQRRFEDLWRGGIGARYPDKESLVRRFTQIRAPMLAIGVDDDEFATPRAVERLLAYFINCPTKHLRISPRETGEAVVGHFGFFNRRFAKTLWPIALRWLTNEDVLDRKDAESNS
ncbi:alpha/beta hydrolase [Bradyrhizobium icense]|uniref:Alpha/beta hydrolase n=2 Tax=Bradyrhizobium icense TaxID=1274631 RepID=A0A1B1URF5_9BRAD|nr:alpha/beta hydrolase [Bradyrhizobium icense]